MKIDARNPRHWLLLLLQLIHCMVVIVVRPFRRPPDTPLVVLYGHQFSGNLKGLYTEWSHNFSKDFDLSFLSLDPEYSQRLKADRINVLQCSRLQDMLKLCTASAIVSDHGLHLMSPLLRFTDIVFVDVWHGIPFKGFTPQDFKLQHRYQEIWVSSELLKQVYCEQFGFKAEQVQVLGYARTDKLFQQASTTLSNDQQLPNRRKNILYAPTWRQDDSGRELFPFGQSAEVFLGRLDRLCEKWGAILTVRSHLNAEIDRLGLDNVQYCSQADFPDTESLLLDADVLVCDWSSIAFDFLCLKRPLLFLDVTPPFQHGFSLDDTYRAGEIIPGMDTLEQSLETYLKNPAVFSTRFSGVQENIIAEVYDRDTMGVAASSQLKRLRRLIEAP